MGILQNINGHEDLIRLSDQDREVLCREIRDFLVSNVSQTGGHLASNLGVVELTVAVETVFDTSIDRLVFDVGHQSYVHKLLTGRQADFAHLRQFGGIAGFPKPGESQTDAFVAGHASSSVSIALGMARARTLMGENYNIVTLLGDGAATGGMVYEGLNDAAVSNEPMIVILNDNAMSIDRNVGGMASHLSRIRTTEQYLEMKESYKQLLRKLPGGKVLYDLSSKGKDLVKRMLIQTTIFDNMGMTYLGPVDGHDLPTLISLLRVAKDMKRPVLLHVMTQKGKGYPFAEQHPSKFHGIGKFDPATGELMKKSDPSFSDAFGEAMLDLAKTNERLCAITAAMPGGTGLLEFKKQYPKRTFDVGIAEEHAVSMAGGLAKQGMVPVVAIYSTFLQRAYDQIQQDVAMLGLHVVFAVDRAGLVGEDGETHHGVYDLGFLSQIPNIKVLCPGSRQELKDMLRWAVEEYNGPVAIRYPRGGDGSFTDSVWPERVFCHRTGKDATLVTYGTLLENAMQAAGDLSSLGIEATVLCLTETSPLPIGRIRQMLPQGAPVIVLEEVCTGSGIREKLAWQLNGDFNVYGMDLGHQFVTHGDMASLYHKYGLDPLSISKCVQEVIQHEN